MENDLTIFCKGVFSCLATTNFLTTVIFSIESSYSNADFPTDIFPIRSGNTLHPEEYVQMMKDVLRMNKNLCLCRHFSQLDKDFTR